MTGGPTTRATVTIAQATTISQRNRTVRARDGEEVAIVQQGPPYVRGQRADGRGGGNWPELPQDLVPSAYPGAEVRGGPAGRSAGRARCGRQAVAGGHAAGMGTPVSGQRFRLTRASRCSRAMAPGSSSPGRVSTAPVADHPVEELPALLGPHDGQRPVVEGADATGRDVGVLGGEVGARGAALAGPGVRLLERDLVEAAVLRPHLEHALDVHLGDVLPGDPVPGLEQLGEDGVVEGLGAQQTDGQGEPAGDLAGLAGLHHRRVPTPGTPCPPGRSARHPPSMACG